MDFSKQTKIDEETRRGGYGRLPLRALRSVARDGWDPVRADLARVTAPVLVVRSAQDHVVPASSTTWLLEHLETPDVSELVLDGAGHLVARDPGAPRAFAACLDFVHRVAPSSADA